jgi:hypothetical protein
MAGVGEELGRIIILAIRAADRGEYGGTELGALRRRPAGGVRIELALTCGPLHVVEAVFLGISVVLDVLEEAVGICSRGMVRGTSSRKDILAAALVARASRPGERRTAQALLGKKRGFEEEPTFSL